MNEWPADPSIIAAIWIFRIKLLFTKVIYYNREIVSLTHKRNLNIDSEVGKYIKEGTKMLFMAASYD